MARSPLTAREGQVLALIASGASIAAIALKLGIEVPTVRKHKENLMRKLGLHSTAEVVLFAIRNGLNAAPPRTRKLPGHGSAGKRIR